jgi:uncharacterized protein (UPF0332 family)
MNADAADLWSRALQALDTADSLLQSDPDASASRAYYAAFNAVSAHFAVHGQTFTKHSAVESAVHRDLVKSGLWVAELGASYTSLVNIRTTGDYGGGVHVTNNDARAACAAARTILMAVCDINPALTFER